MYYAGRQDERVEYVLYKYKLYIYVYFSGALYSPATMTPYSWLIQRRLGRTNLP